MSHHHDEIKVPKSLLLAAGALLIGITSFVGVSQVTGIGTSTMPTEPQIETVAVSFRDESDGGVGAYHPETDVQLFEYGPGEGGFVRTALRSLALDRRKSGIGAEPPFELMRSAKNNVVLRDPMTNKYITLNAFGDANQSDFAQLFESAPDVANP